MQREFLGWERPALQAVVDYLAQRYPLREGTWDLSPIMLVLPGARAGRRLAELLAIRAAASDIAFLPPSISTVGQLPESLYVRRRPFASPLVQQLAWTHVLRTSSATTLQEFLGDIPSDAKDARWLELGVLLWKQHRELAAEGLDFQHILSEGSGLPGFDEQARWQALSQIQQSYLQCLDSLGLWDRQTARLFAIEHHECRTDLQLILVGTVDLSRALRQMLDQVSDSVTALVIADSTWSDRFDEYGCVEASAWLTSDVLIRDRDLFHADGPSDQARVVMERIAALDGQYAADQITVGVPDESLVPTVLRQLRAAEVPCRYGPGRSIEASAPFRLVRAMVDYLLDARLTTLLDILRHPDATMRLEGEFEDLGDLVGELDTFATEHLPDTVDRRAFGAVVREFTKSAPPKLSERGGDRSRVSTLIQSIDGWLVPLRGDVREPQQWVQPWLDLISKIYGDRQLDPDAEHDRMVLMGCEALRDGLIALESVPTVLGETVTAAQAMLMAISTVSSTTVPAPDDEPAVELLGWLELVLDDAPVLIVTNLNEGSVPASSTSDLFLPDNLRSRVGVDDNQRRYARDAYALSVLAESRRHFSAIIGRRDLVGNPLLPSRLLFATSDERRVQRALRFFREADEREDLINQQVPLADPTLASTSVPCDQASDIRIAVGGFEVPRPRARPLLQTLNVTDFRIYLECPYRYYLTRVLKLRSVTSLPRELDAAAFGNRLHEVLEQFGVSDVKDVADSERINEFLQAALHDVFLKQYGPKPNPVVRLQRTQLGMRLEAFSRVQAEWRRRGWRIHLTEGDQRSVIADWKVDDQPLKLKGRIDRVDVHESSGAYAILDYKSSDTATTPRKAHHPRVKMPRQAADWVDLQLPMYRHLARHLNITGPLKLGYVHLPKQISDCAVELADWTSEDLASADAAAEHVVRAIREGVFWPPTEGIDSFDEGLARICLERVFGATASRIVADSNSKHGGLAS